MRKVYPLILGNMKKETRDYLTVKAPYDNQEVGQVSLAGEAEIELAIQKAVEAFEILKFMPVYQKEEILHQVSLAIKARGEELARIIALEGGKPITFAKIEVARCAELFAWAAEETKRFGGEIVPLDLDRIGENRMGINKRFPIGPVLAITPFNFPLNLVAHKVAPALAVGNPIIIKPSPATPITAIILGEIIAQTDLPEGSISVLPCKTALAEKMVKDERIAMFTFTGSPKVGWYLKKEAGRKRVTLELGGNAALIVDSLKYKDFLLERAIIGGYYHAGQVCISIQRIFIQESLYDTFLQEFIDRVKRIPVGDPLDEKTITGPLINKSSADQVYEWIQEAVADGAKLLVGGERHSQSPCVITPAVLTNTTPDMKVNSLEVFGPVVTIEPYEKFEDAIAMTNNSIYGLQAGVFTDDLSHAFYAYNHLDVGGVIINDIPTYRSDPMPYGGVKMSGCGREGIKYAMEEMTEGKFLALKYA
ncbi:aldehyde dehydrogenase family protein [Desulfohalobiaceae bacterium Ax17]|uniref:aldehyde dehydrogenase family protein n=1 Tax=Desulfovulcanus ferrireducens TaxID=2831190 RepID=UPI00207B9AB1|nr:aldehyde dehydrogenase family protein [Desulfovulcanus ferrireducens]